MGSDFIYGNRWSTVLMHILFWILFFTFPYLMHAAVSDDLPNLPIEGKAFYLVALCDNLVRMGLFYFNAYYLIPRFVYRKKYGTYLSFLLGGFIVHILISKGLFNLVLEEKKESILHAALFNSLPFAFVIAAGSALRIMSDRVIEDRITKEKETEHLKTELSFLRSQVSPHFLFNVLNNMVSLARKKSDELEPSLMKLSSMLRYMLYETDENKVPLQREERYLNSYIDLQRQRFGSKLTIKTFMNSGETKLLIEPMLLIPFVENAFKHGTGLTGDGEIIVQLTVQNNTLSFLVRNRYQENDENSDRVSGIGLVNVTRRLDLLYANKHTLFIKREDGYFTVLVTLQLLEC